MGLPYRSIAAYAIGLTMVISAAMFKYNSPITELRIDIIALPVGKNLINEKDITGMLMESFKTDFVGWKMKEVDTEIIEKEIDSNEFVKEVRVYVDARNRLTIMIEQREPVLRVQDTNGMSFYLDREGFRLPISKHYTARVRVATGELPRFEGRHLMSAQPIYKSLFTVSMAMSADPFYDAYVEQIHVDKEGEMYASPKIGDQKIRLGKAQNIESKLDNLRTFVEEVVPYQGWEVCQMIDLRFKDQIVCTRNNKMISLNNSIK